MKKLMTLALCSALFVTSVVLNTSFAAEQKYSDNLIPVMTSNSGTNGIVPFSNGEYMPTIGFAFKAFDGMTGPATDGQLNYWESNSGKGTGVLGVRFPSAVQVTKMTLTSGYAHYGCKKWNVEASDNGVSWEVLGTYEKTSWTPADIYTMEFNNDKKYTQYRLNILSANGGSANCLVGELQMFSPLAPTVQDETITIETPINEIEIGKEFTTDVVLHNGVNVCAEDVVVNYDKNLFEYLGYEEAAGFRVYKEMPADGSVRFITASKGKVNAINGDKTFVKLKFRAKQEGIGKVDAMTARIADNGTYEKDLKVDLCGEKVIKVTGIKDVNRTGKFTLLDLGIDAWYHGMKAEETDKSKYDCDVVVDSNIDDLDLSSIVTAMLANPEYRPHTVQ